MEATPNKSQTAQTPPASAPAEVKTVESKAYDPKCLWLMGCVAVFPKLGIEEVTEAVVNADLTFKGQDKLWAKLRTAIKGNPKFTRSLNAVASHLDPEMSKTFGEDAPAEAVLNAKVYAASKIAAGKLKIGDGPSVALAQKINDANGYKITVVTVEVKAPKAKGATASATAPINPPASAAVNMAKELTGAKAPAKTTAPAAPAKK